MQERNDLGLQLIERNEEVCVFYERQNVSESLLRKAGMELSAREEELHFLRMEVREGGERKGREGGTERDREGGREGREGRRREGGKREGGKREGGRREGGGREHMQQLWNCLYVGSK